MPQCVYSHCHWSYPKPLSTLSLISSVACTASPLPLYPSSCISIAAFPVVPHLHRHKLCLPYSLYRIFTAPPLSSSNVSVAVLIVLSSIVLCTLLPLFLYLLRSDLLLNNFHSELHQSLHSDLHYLYHYPIWYSHHSYLFSLVTYILYIQDVLATLQSASFFSTCLHYALFQSDHSPSDLSVPICLLNPCHFQLWISLICLD